MLLFQKRFLEGIVDGSITRTFRSWTKPQVKPGGLYRCHPIGVVAVDDITTVRVADIKPKDAKAAGFATRDELLDYMRSYAPDLSDKDELYRVDFHYAGDGDRAPTAFDENLSDEDVAKIASKLAKYDESEDGPWTRATLELIAKNPKIAASKLAKQVGREKLPFKADVVKLKKLGLTQSFEVGYEVTPRGREFMKRVGWA